MTRRLRYIPGEMVGQPPSPRLLSLTLPPRLPGCRKSRGEVSTHKRCWTCSLLLPGHRKLHMERASSGRAAFCPDHAFMEFDNAFANRQAKAEAIDLPRNSCCSSREMQRSWRSRVAA